MSGDGVWHSPGGKQAVASQRQERRQFFGGRQGLEIAKGLFFLSGNRKWLAPVMVVVVKVHPLRGGIDVESLPTVFPAHEEVILGRHELEWIA